VNKGGLQVETPALSMKTALRRFYSGRTGVSRRRGDFYRGRGGFYGWRSGV
jgi:hypothetical protein